GRPINAFEAIARNLMRAIDGLPGMYGVGIICMILNRQQRRLGDYVAGTVVVHDKAMAEIKPHWTSNEAARPGLQLAQISSDELVLIETYLHRRFELELIVRAATAQRIVALVKERSGLAPASGQSDDDFLEAVAREARDSARLRGPA
ncbi:MAG TPA: RDD family protein, partial [Terriglobales bacterium]|nr:RDD family protein [Terriglobales bacterium]